MSAAFSVPVCRHHPLHVRWMRCVLAVAVVALAPVPVMADEPSPTRVGEIVEGKGDFAWKHFDGDQERIVQVWTYRPSDFGPRDPIVFVMHGMLRNGETYRQPWISIADRARFLIVVPEFSSDQFPASRSYQFGNLRNGEGQWNPEAAWSFTAVEGIFDQVREVTGSEAEGYYIFGHSAGSQFVHRMAIFKSQMRAKLAIAANAGSYTMPTRGVAYPYGLGGVEMDDEEWKGRLSRPLVVLLGSEDTDPEDSSLPRRPGAMAQGPHRVARGDRFFRTAEAEAERLGISLGWQKRGVPGVGHDNKRMAPAAAALIRDHHQATVR